MKKTKSDKPKNGMRAEYDLRSLKGGVRGKYFKQYQAGTNLALLSPDIRAAFPTDASVNKALRSLLKAKS